MTIRPPDAQKLILDLLPTPIGVALLVFDPKGRLCVLYWKDHEHRMLALLKRRYGITTDLEDGRGPAGATAALESYFEGDIGAINGIECATVGTPFQQSVWQALRTIPAGQTFSYGLLAAKLGVPNAVRAVGLANGSNPVSVVIPCHRVIGSDGTLTGYGGGLDRKRWLLTHEGASFRDERRTARNASTAAAPTLFALD